MCNENAQSFFLCKLNNRIKGIENRYTKFCGLIIRKTQQLVAEKNVEKNEKKMLTRRKSGDILSERSREQRKLKGLKEKLKKL